MLQGYGTHFYSDCEYYEGEWYGNKRSGWGRMYYADGSVYEGEWYDNQRSGQGMLRLGENSDQQSLKPTPRLPQGNVYILCAPCNAFSHPRHQNLQALESWPQVQ